MKLITDRPDFYNDICDVIRLFLPRASIALIDGSTGETVDRSGVFGDERLIMSEDGELTASCVSDGERFIANAVYAADGSEHRCTYSSPYRGGSELIEKRYAKRAVKVAVFRAMHKAFAERTVPWGSLTGIRPTRLLRELIDTEGRSEALRLMTEEFDVTPEKLELADRIVSAQRPIIDSASTKDFDVYVGIPFCRTRCLYCSFASQLRTKKTDMSAYLNALMTDISMGAALAADAGLNSRAFYIGGGTPTILTADELDRLLSHICRCYDTNGKEFTVEAGRPDTITKEKLLVLKRCGVDRVSVNPQTMCDKTLRLVGRDHTAQDLVDCYEMVKGMGFASVNCDVIAGLPNETEDDMRLTLEAIKALEPECLTVHTLAVKRSSRLHEHLDEYDMPDGDTVERMVALGADAASSMGMIPYYMYRQKYMTGNFENVGYAKPESICIYNIDMMEDGLSIIAHGAGAMTKRVFFEAGRIDRVANPKDIDTYIAKIEATNAQRRELFGC